MVFHRDNYGMFGRKFLADMRGLVATTPKEVRGLAWECKDYLVDGEAEAIAERNAEALRAADAELAAWRNNCRL